MADQVLNIAKGAVAEKIRDGANIQIIAITDAETDAVLRDKDTVSDFVSGATNEATQSGYARKSISNASITLTVDDTNDRVDVDVADQTWTAVASGGSAWTDLLFAEDVGGADSSRVPLTMQDFVITPDGSDITATIANFFRAS
jgi:hypothetical protein